MNNRFFMIAILIAMAFLIGCPLTGDPVDTDNNLSKEVPVTCTAFTYPSIDIADVSLVVTQRVCGNDMGVTQISCTVNDNPLVDYRCFTQDSLGCVEVINKTDYDIGDDTLLCAPFEVWVSHADQINNPTE